MELKKTYGTISNTLMGSILIYRSSRVKGRVIKYKVGDNLDDLDLLITQGSFIQDVCHIILECTTEKLTISLMDAETYEELDSLQDEKQNIIIKVYIIGGECPFDFLAVFTPDSQVKLKNKL
jgi:hypothetical protein